MDIKAPSADNLLLGAGALYINRKDAAGVGLGMVHAGNCETLEITTEDDVLEKYESMTRSRSLYKSVTRKRTVRLRAVLDEFNGDNLALALMGNKAQSAAVIAGAVVGEELAAAFVAGAYYKTAKLGPISAVSVDFGATPGVEGVDYEIANAAVGIIRVLPDTAQPAGAALTIDYTPTAYADGLTQVRGGTETTVRASLLFVGDPNAGPPVMVEIWDVQVAPDGALGLISEDFATLALQMTVQSDIVNHADAPLYLVTYL